MHQQKIPQFSVTGITVRTTNEDQQAAKDIPALWNRFIKEDTAGKIPDKTDTAVYCIYTGYEKDHTRPYDVVLGCKVAHLNNIPEGMTGLTIEQADYVKYTATGNALQGSVFNEWLKIWQSDLNRTFIADFEVYDEKSWDPEHGVVDIFAGVQ